MSSAAGPSSNWEKLKKSLPTETRRSAPARKKRRGGGVGAYAARVEVNGDSESASARERWAERGERAPTKAEVVVLPPPSDNRMLPELRQMVEGTAVLTEAKKAPGNYVAIDCEMVGLGHLGAESALARVSLVNYHGHVLLDTFVAPRERVTDYRTWVSGIRASDLLGAPTFDTVQKQVAALVEGRIVIGHAIENDMKALLLSHPAPYVRDTQKCKALREVAKTKLPGLKRLAELELGLKIQAGQHSSVTDARATMALYRLHKGPWEASLRSVMEAYARKTGTEGPVGVGKKKRKRGDDGDDDDKDKPPPGGGRRGISSGLSVVVRRYGKKVESDQPRRRGPAPATRAAGNWWEEAAG